jgi:Mce-associated membrane protein
VPPPRRRPATPPARRPKVAGLHRPATAPQEPGEDEVTQVDLPVIGEDPQPSKPAPKTRDSGVLAPVEPEPTRTPRRRRREADPVVPPPIVEMEPDVAEAVLEPGKAREVEDAEDLDATDRTDTTNPTEPTEPDGTEVAEVVAEPRQPNFLLPIALVLAALLVAGLGWWFVSKNADARVGSGNAALVDVNATKDVVGAAQKAVTGVLSYKFDAMDKAAAQAKQYLSGEAVDQYQKSMDALAKNIQDQKLQVTVNAVSVGVVRLNGDDARVLVFADQIGVRADNQPSGGPTQFAMDMHRTDGNWKIVKLDFFDSK